MDQNRGHFELWDLASATCLQILDSDDAPSVLTNWQLGFSSDGRQLLCARGALDLGGGPANSTGHPVAGLADFYVRDNWVTYDASDVLWIPPEYRPPRSIMCDSILALCHSSGTPDAVEFDRARLVRASPSPDIKPGAYVWVSPATMWSRFFRRVASAFTAQRKGLVSLSKEPIPSA